MSALIVDLDGTLTNTDCSVESLCSAIVKNPLIIFYSIIWYVKGKPYLKKRLFDASNFQVKNLPFNDSVIEIIKDAKVQNEKIYLFTGSTQKIADEVSDHLNLFDGSFGSNEKINLTSYNKLTKIRDIIGHESFSYVGNSKADLPVWEEAEKIYIVSNFGESLKNKLKNKAPKVVLKSGNSYLSFIKIMRPYQWLKNVLVFVPFFIYEYSTVKEFWMSIIGFVSFSLAASSVYILNDFLDVSSDREHPTKKQRPFASGELSLIHSFWMIPVLLIPSLILASSVSLNSFIIISSYLLITFLYSLYLKKVLILDICILASLYTLRLIGGAIFIQSEFSLSPWLINFSIFFFFFLACIKRESELIIGIDSKKENSRRSYFEEDKKIISTLSVSSGLLSVLVLLLYAENSMNSSAFSSPILLWFLSPIFLYWISRFCIISSRGFIKEDPLFFAIKDRVSILFAILVFTIISAAKFLEISYFLN